MSVPLNARFCRQRLQNRACSVQAQLRGCASLTERAEVRLTTLPPRMCLIGRREIGDNRASAFPELPDFGKLLTQNGLFSTAER